MSERDDHNELELFEGDEDRRLDRTFRNESRRPPRRAGDEEIEPEHVKDSEGDAARKAAKPFAPSKRIPRDQFRVVVTKAMLGDTKERDRLITLTHDLGQKVLRQYEEEIRHRAINAVTDKFFVHTGMLGGIALGVYFDYINRGGALDTFLVRSLKNAAVDELRKKIALRDAVDIATPYELAFEGDDGEQLRSPALKAQRLGHHEDSMPIIPGADTLDPLRQLTAQEMFEAVVSANLTPRERQVADLLLEGVEDPENRTDEQIAAKLIPRVSPSRARALIAKVREKIRAARDAAS